MQGDVQAKSAQMGPAHRWTFEPPAISRSTSASSWRARLAARSSGLHQLKLSCCVSLRTLILALSGRTDKGESPWPTRNSSSSSSDEERARLERSDLEGQGCGQDHSEGAHPAQGRSGPRPARAGRTRRSARRSTPTSRMVARVRAKLVERGARRGAHAQEARDAADPADLRRREASPADRAGLLAAAGRAMPAGRSVCWPRRSSSARSCRRRTSIRSAAR